MAGKPTSVSLFCNSSLRETLGKEDRNWESKGYMGYNQKTTYCNFDELEIKGGLATISTIFGSNSLEGQKAKGGGSIVDLKLGKNLGDSVEGFAKIFKGQRACVMEPFSSSAGSSKRARAPGGSSQVVSCLVDGCKSDLSKCRDYHRRHKVCEMHSKTPKVTIGGHEQRFCQQCSRFHSLGEFDEGKRSCRKRLEGHNRRRRKPQPEPLPVNQGNFLSAAQGSRYLPFSNQPISSPNSVVTTTWSGPIKAESSQSMYSSSPSRSYPDHVYRGRQFPFLPGSNPALTGASSSVRTLHYDPGNDSNNHGQKMLYNGLNQVIDSNRALSLLSSPPSDTPEMGLGRIIHPSLVHPDRSMIPSLHHNSSISLYPGSQSQDLEGQPGSSELISNIKSSNSLCQDVFHTETDGSSGSGGHQTLSFTWE